jgi:GTP-binding protein HflX
VRHLPHQLIDAFRSTLEEVTEADLVLHVVDGSDPDPESQISAVRQVFADIGAGEVPELVVINKADAADPLTISRLRRALPDAIIVSARTGEGLQQLLDELAARAPHPPVELRALVPYTRGDLVARAHEIGEVLACEHLPGGTLMQARVPAGLATLLSQFPPPSDGGPALEPVDGGATGQPQPAVTSRAAGTQPSDLAQHRHHAS